MDMPVNVPIDDPNADTEWNDILRKHGVIPEKPPSPTPMIEEAILQARELAHENRLEGKDLDELGELEDEEDEEFLALYKQKRLAELSALSQKSRHGRVYHLQKPEYSSDVTATSKEYIVFVNMTAANAESRLLSALWRQAAEKYADVKFCEIVASMCIEGYPDANCPTILVYKDEDIIGQHMTLKTLRGLDTRLEDIEKILVSVEAIQSADQRLQRRAEEDGGETRSRINSKNVNTEVDDDDDWD